MGLIRDFVTEKEKEFLSIHKAILIMKHFCNESGRTIGIFLGQTQIFKNLPLYKKDDFLSFNIVEDNVLTHEILEYLASGKTDNSGFFPNGVQKSFWKISDFLDFPPIKRLRINQDVVEHFLNYKYYSDKSNNYEPFKDFSYTNKPVTQKSKAPPPTKPVIGSYYSNPIIKKDNREIERLQLQNALNQAQERIKQLEAKLKTNQALGELTPEQEISSTKTRNRIGVLIAVLCELNELNITSPYGDANKLVLEKATQLRSPLGKDFVAKWLEVAQENIQ